MARRVVVYVRRSVKDGDSGRSLPEQEAACRRFVEAQGLGSVVEVYREQGSGCSGEDRPVFVSMVEAGERQEFETLVVLDLSRFGRFTVDERGFWLHRLKRAGVDVRYVVDDAALTGEAGPIMGAVMQSSARDHSVKTAFKVAMGMVATVERGCWPGGPTPYGYRLQRREGWQGKGRKDSTLVVHEEEAAVVRRMFELYLAGKGNLVIASTLNEEGVRKPKGSGASWTVGTVRGILSNPVYQGDVVRARARRGKGRRLGRFYQGTASGPVSVEHGPTDGYEKVGSVPAVVDRETWARVQAEASRRNRPDSFAGGRPHLLTGLVRCGLCGSPLVVGNGGTTGKRFRYYRCARRGDAECKRVSVREDALEPLVLARVREVVAGFDVAAIAEGVRKSLPKVERVDVAALEGKRRRLAQRRDELVLSENAFERAGLAALAVEDERLVREIEAARKAQEGEVDVEALAREVAEDVSRLEAPELEGEGREKLRSLLKVFVRSLKVFPKSKQKKTDKYTTPFELAVLDPTGVAVDGLFYRDHAARSTMPTPTALFLDAFTRVLRAVA